MKEGWQTKNIDEVCEFSNGLWKGEKPPFVRIGVIRNTNFTKQGTLDDSDIAYLDVEAKKFEKRRLRLGDIILEKSGGGPKQPVGRVILFDKADGDFSFSNFTSSLRVRDPHKLYFRFLHKFLHWTYLSGVTEGMQSHSTGIRNLDGDAYKAIEINFPPLPEQKRIVAILDEALEGIDRAIANTEKNLANAREVFNSYITSIFEIGGKIWQKSTIGDEVSLLTGFAFRSQAYTNDVSGVPLLRGDNIVQGKLRWDDVKRWPSSDRAAYSDYEMAEGDIVLAMDRTWIKAGIKLARITQTDIPALLVQRVARMRCKHTLSNGFLFYLLASKQFERYVLEIQTGLGVPHISGGQIQAFRFKRPDLATQQRIVDNMDAMRARCETLVANYERKLTLLNELKSAILQKAFAGELAARSAEYLQEAAQ